MDIGIDDRQIIGYDIYGGVTGNNYIGRLAVDDDLDDLDDHDSHVAFGDLDDNCPDCHPERDVLRWLGRARGVDTRRGVRGGRLGRRVGFGLSRLARDRGRGLVRAWRR
jgi:hypothetical protein